ncbi:RNA polymerase II subunit Rpb5b [Giardia muris]|uniref:RNA polymerase II subunit Rpb5b n=1 Tax=Giardia muris TaxID=5742 RepID=A0A4Z1SPU4_GIAMU|nr:RNA polymerase II subunit Rpb5b [Giardia muris]|eukprot:TNJ27680.1 RNA polymerase II subunit Rpb5b [Giardia muris]
MEDLKLEVIARIHTNSIEMMEARGYDVTPVIGQTHLTEKGIDGIIGSGMDVSLLSYTVTRDQKRCLLAYAWNLPEARRLAERDDCAECIVVCNLKQKSYDSRHSVVNDTAYELYHYEWLLVNPTSYYLVPQHRMLSELEKEQVLKRLSAQEHQLPRISPDDPIMRWYGVKPGTLIQIIRKSDVVGDNIYYRLCC